MLGISSSLVKGGASLLTFVKDNLKLYLDFKSNKSDTLKFPSEGSTEFDGSDDYIDFGDISLTGEFTLSAWIYLNSTSYMVIWGDSSNADWFRITSATTADIKIAGNTKNLWTHGATFTTGEWQHIAVVRDSSNQITIYRNGIHYTSNAPTRSGTFVPEYLGQKENGAYFNGKMANNAIWSRALTTEEIQSIMNKSYSQLKGVEKTPSLVSWWALDNTEYMRANVSTFMNNTTGWVGTAELVDGVMTVSSHNAYRYFNSFINSVGYSGANAYIRLEVTAKKTSGSPVLDFEGTTFFDLTTEYQTYTIDVNYENSTGNNFFRVPNASGTDQVLITSFNAYPFGSKDSHGSNNGDNYKMKATTSVYGGNAPILPRAVDVAKEGQADAIGNGSANFTIGNTDYIEIKNTGIVLQDWSISFWVRTGANLSGSYPGIVSTRSGTNNDYEDGVTIQYFSNYFDAEGASQSGHLPKVAGNTGLADGEWYHLVYTSDRNGQNKQYINGIFITEESAVDNPTNADIIQIGARFYNNAVREYWDGDIAQVGFWQGILDQPKVQKLYESTSYSKIPADVKSTLGSEIITSNTTSEWAQYGSGGSEANTTNGVSLTAGSDTRNSYRTVSGLTDGKLYKLNVDAYYSGTSDTVKIEIIPGSGSLYTPVLTTTSTNYTIYFVKNSGTMYILGNGFDNGNVLYVENLSIKEVTNDIVAYYPLDGDSSANGATQDVTTGETTTLISNRDFAGVADGTDPTTLSYIFAYGTPGEKTIDNERLKIVDSSNTGVYWKETGLTSSKLYKITIEATGDVASGGVYSTNISFTLSNGTFTGYVTGETQIIVYLRANNNSAGTTFYDNLKTEEVTSNTGVLK